MEDLLLHCIIWTLACLPWIFYTIVVVMFIASFLNGYKTLYQKTAACEHLEVLPGVSVIKPLLGVDGYLYENIESYFMLQYPKFELLFCVQDPEDPAIALVIELQNKYPHIQSKLFIGGKNGIVNPMVHNMAPAYAACIYDLVWISSCRVKVTDEVLQDLIGKIQKPNVALVHQMPFISNHNDLPTITEKIYFGTVVPRYYFTSQMFGITCFTGMSYLVKKQELDKIKGLVWYGKYLAEDYFIASTLAVKGFQHEICAFPGIQNLASTSLVSFKERMIRWQRLRVNMLPVTVLELFVECLPLSVFMCWSLYYFLRLNPIFTFLVQMSAWCLVDYIQLREVQGGPLPFSVIRYLECWSVRQLLYLVIYMQALLNVKTIYWGPNKYRLANFGRTVVKIHEDESSQSLPA